MKRQHTGRGWVLTVSVTCPADTRYFISHVEIFWDSRFKKLRMVPLAFLGPTSNVYVRILGFSWIVRWNKPKYCVEVQNTTWRNTESLSWISRLISGRSVVKLQSEWKGRRNVSRDRVSAALVLFPHSFYSWQFGSSQLESIRHKDQEWKTNEQWLTWKSDSSVATVSGLRTDNRVSLLSYRTRATRFSLLRSPQTGSGTHLVSNGFQGLFSLG